MQLYKHTQVGALTLGVFGFAVVFTTVLLLVVPEGRVVTAAVLVILLLCLLVFRALTVEVSTEGLTASFGLGVIRRRFRIEDIRDARAVKNPWYYGWGIRWTPHGWMFNVSGFDAVELVLENDRRFRIGTDDPGGLVAALQRAFELHRL